MNNRKQPQLFLDCDGVLADFDVLANQIYGKPPHQAEDEIGSSRFWHQLRSHPDFYGTLPLMPDALQLFEAVRHLKPVILTGCPQGDWAQPQKLRWAAKHFPGTPIITCRSAEKRVHMRPGDVLVDDFLRYKHLWEEAGGVFIHHTSAASTIARLRELRLL